MLLLLDALGNLVAQGIERAALVPALAAPLGPGSSLPTLLAAHAADGDADAQALASALGGVLDGRWACTECRRPGWRARVEALAGGGVAAVALRLEPAAEDAATLHESLAEARRRLELVQSVAGVGIWTVDLDARTAEASDETCRLLARDPSRGPLAPQEIRSRAHPEDLPAMREARERVLAGEPLVRSRFRLRGDDGRERWFEARMTLQPAAGGRPRRVVGTLRDVGDLVRDQQQLERDRARLEDLVVARTVQLADAAQRAEAAARTRSAVLAQCSHELRTPLNVIGSLSHLVARGLPDGPLHERLRAIEDAARQLGEIVNDWLERVQAGDEGTAARGPALEVAAPLAGKPSAPGPTENAPGRPPPGQPPVAADPAPPHAAEPLRALRQRHGGRRVLLAEDDELSQIAMLELLADAGLAVDTADDGSEAVDKATHRDYALILLDLRMPRLDGLAAARRLRAMPALHGTPIVAITANTFDEDRVAARAAGMDDFLSKPVEVARLYRTLLHWLDRVPAADARAGRPAAAPAAAFTAAATLAAAAVPAAAVPAAVPPSAAAGVDPIAPLLGLEGIDAERGLASVGGRAAVYHRLLGIFGDTHAGDGQRLLELLRGGDAGAAVALAHRVRGSAATLGLIDVETAAGAVEHALERRGGDALPLASAFDEALSATLARLQRALRG